ncbi:hypothetical protein A3K29_05285 [Candidatus Collierbacteria bacterium RIFOXYB2_FULL_46_14]|uniref:Gluconeogenesis factor n=1 Tax=Candidatus Collierbacteria bacterium GW2011_GWA2_46_26 TaxID=1618381 RepID=A0A0G1PL37_9BACT|nr:MAG: hypothetical protein UX47_C0004G0057 [Candidatus Collierbacteria bacterium GW2011_GWA2_46_26]OGD73507.1 MAG: hypothetical protein A3K29_05285 [Candidatus Collierbacteria bacterium RIFOXYB2_FULL_46_14]OGD76549.1 MAG: hypothetical protein A3K43_05285 [Candidatus Collierbacteria bacterium RIFOXYA2_FULL_46_20]OGD77885.1 MAG: hypothetical protein A3K39_05285 [Candidatus Collierbacteria bacterium RIFOXYC2_FULL_43_15]OGD81175.1 MAG: hypothetical protein A2320_05780 [Pseudomonadales bacterium G
MKTRIVTIGGGTGAPVIIQALLQAGFTDLSCICASMDSGGKTGIIRSDERDQVIAISDLLRNLLALITSANHKKNISAFTDMVSFVDGRQRNLGYTIYYALLEKYQNNFLRVQEHLEELLGIRFGGTAIPITTDSSNLYFKTKAGQIFRGEHELDKQSMSKNTITKLWLDPKVQASPEAIRAIKTAKYIIYCPGSLYGSILSNFLPDGIKKALKASKAKKILITNLVSNRNQTHHFTPRKYLHIFQKYTGLKKPFNILLAPKQSKMRFNRLHPKIAASYACEHSHFLGWSSKKLRGLSRHHIKVVTSNTISITPQLNRLRHDPTKLAKILKKIIK